MEYLKLCVDYNTLKENLNNKQLTYIGNILKHYEDYINQWYKEHLVGNYVNEDRDYTEYTQQFGNNYIIEWYEGLMTTEELLKEIQENNYLGI